MKKILLLVIVSCNTFGMGSGDITLRLKNIILQEATEQTPAVIEKVFVTIPEDKSWKIGEMSTVLEKELWRKRLDVKKSSYCSDVSQMEFELCSNALEIMPGETFTKYFNEFSKDNKGHLINGAEKLGAMGLTCQLMKIIFSEDIIDYFDECLAKPIIDYCFQKTLSQQKKLMLKGNITTSSNLQMKDEDFDWCGTKILITNPTTSTSYYYKVENSKIVDNITYIIVTDCENKDNRYLFCIFSQNQWQKNGLPVGEYNSFSGNGKCLATTNQANNQVVIRKLEIKADYSDFPITFFTISSVGTVEDLLFCPDSKHLCIISSNDQEKTYMEIWNVETNEQIYMQEWDNPIERIIFTPSGDKLIAISNCFHCTVLDPTTGATLLTMQESTCAKLQKKDEILMKKYNMMRSSIFTYNHSVAFSHDEKYCIIGVVVEINEQYNTVISVFNLHTGACLTSGIITNEKLFSLSLTPTMQYIPFYIESEDDDNLQENAPLKFELNCLTLYDAQHANGFNELENNTTLLEKYALYRLFKAAESNQKNINLHILNPMWYTLATLYSKKGGITYLMDTYFAKYYSIDNLKHIIKIECNLIISKISSECDEVVSKIKKTWNNFFH